MKRFTQGFLMNAAAGVVDAGAGGGGAGGAAGAAGGTVLEQGAAGAAGAAGGAAGAGTVVNGPWVKEDGTFAQDWHKRPEFEPFKDKGPDRFKDVPTLVKSYYELETKLGQRPAEGVRVPGADAPADQVKAYRAAIGVPDVPTGYDLKPAELPPGITWDDKAGLAAAEMFHKHGIPAAAAKEIVAHQMKSLADSHLAATTAYDNHVASTMEGLQKEWGANYHSKMATVRGVVAAMGMDPADAELFSNGKVLSFLGKVTGMLSEDAVASVKGVVGAGGAGASAAEQARDITRNVNNPEHAKYMAGDPDVTQKVLRLYAQG